jgi:plastocyanin
MRNFTKRHRSGVWRRCRALLIVAALAAVSTWPVRAADMEVNIDNFAFTPKELTVKAGTTIVFHNRDDIPQSVVGSIGTAVPFVEGTFFLMGSNDTVAPVVLVLCRVTTAGDHVTGGRRQRRETDMTSSSHVSVPSGSPFLLLAPMGRNSGESCCCTGSRRGNAMNEGFLGTAAPRYADGQAREESAPAWWPMD